MGEVVGGERRTERRKKAEWKASDVITKCWEGASM